MTQAKNAAEKNFGDAPLKWKQHDFAFRQKMQVPLSYKPWTSHVDFKARGLSKTPRILSIIDAVAIDKIQGRQDVSHKVLKHTLKNVYVDVSQSLPRRTWTDQSGKNRTQCASSLLYSFDRDSIICGREMMMLQCQPASLSVPPGVKDSCLGQLAGEGMSVPCLGHVIWSLMLSTGFCRGCQRFRDSRFAA